MRFGDYLNSIPLPAILTVFKAEEWDNYGLLTVDSNCIYSMIDVLLGGRRVGGQIRIEGRPYTTIEMALARRMIEVLLEDTHQAFEPVTQVKFKLERMETNPRFATISRPANAAILIELRLDDGRSRRQGRDPAALRDDRARSASNCCRCIWARNSAATRSGKAISPPRSMPPRPRSRRCCTSSSCRSAACWRCTPGETLMFDRAPADPIALRCGDVALTEGDHGPYRQPRIGARLAPAQPAKGDDGGIRSFGFKRVEGR